MAKHRNIFGDFLDCFFILNPNFYKPLLTILFLQKHQLLTPKKTFKSNKYQNINLSNSFIATGLGMALETKLGLLNVSYAIGKRNDVKFNIRDASKIHFGYVNYF